ncbi:transformation/transcription domain-associated protein [Odontomachus brunneus]|uniref:transformation/transcription domain-associated protein n=1 Tax=Odontomachus brunneus TaxID=486640 RepID=UPI0013F1917F|nr:transformation/transcription domain-associated protein [Odontomachus brunneus]XP_032685099.1 transformation/transcription domain-associated protein [Odontomachus brunneus]XP_032685100.1 transformation/transcription domain-associated protein [Odontomachus brunneus]XP_032685102.1 transformation/transcription domain-associated protein [Odontomachus brunneus]XP_032685103.1 transformation/transcription domain-associated protein [Odontomachus brunneus]
MPPDPLTQMNTYRSYVTMLADPVSKDELKLKAAQELSENFEIIMCSSQYPAFLDHMMKIFLKMLQEGEPHFISEYNIQQVRKLILEMIHRLPSNEYLRPYVRQILTLISKLLETDNEENVLVCLRIIIELHKQYKPTFNPEIQYFLQFVKSVYSELPKNLPKIFEPRPPLRVKDLSEINIEALLKETFTITAIQSEKKAADGTVLTYNLIPKAVMSLKVLQELPIIVVLMNQLYKQNVLQDVSDFIPIVITTISLQPSPQHRASSGFNKEVFVDFMGAQIKALSFLAYVIRVYQEVITQHSQMLVKGILGLFTLCPMEVAHLRKELVIASRHILATDLRNQFIPHMEYFFNEDIFIGHGWTTQEALRPLAYSTLADLVHHVRLLLPLNDVSHAVHLYSKNLLDPSLPTTVQMVSCKLLMNLVDTVSRQRTDVENSTQGRELLMRILLVFVLKFKVLSKIYIPILRNKTKQLRANTSTTDTSTSEDPLKTATELTEEKESGKSKFGFPNWQVMSYNVLDYRNLVKSLVHGAKAITANCVNRSGETQSNQLQPKETLIYIQLVKWALPALDIYTIGTTVVGTPVQPGRPAQTQTIRSREEKEVLELFGNIFTQMNPQTFQEIFSMSVDYMVERIFKNSALQIIGSAFLSSHTISSRFATILVQYLLERMNDMGSNVERSNLYLRLFKLVFGSVSLFPAENEHMLRPHLNQVVNRAMELAMSAKEPYNYFLLLRALFRSIGGGSHDLLYQEFLPLLPNMLEGLNRLQSGLHRQHMKDLFVELCLTVPVRLSSLLPYLPMLMDPLVSALNGSYCLVSQGLRTLELCVDNLQPDFLYEHIQPVRADLMQALWRILHNSTDQAHVAFRVLGKFGGGNRKMMIEPQKLQYNDRETGSPTVVVYFQGPACPIDFSMEKVIETAYIALKSSTTDLYYRKQCCEVVNCYLAATLRLDDVNNILHKLFTHPSFHESEISFCHASSQYKCPDTVARDVQQTAVTSLFIAAETKELRPLVIGMVISIVRHYTMIAIAQQAGLFSWTERDIRTQGQDPLVLIDALASIMSHEEKDLHRMAYLVLMLILDTATKILGSKERACRLPIIEYAADRMCMLCYERAWYTKLGGCIGIKFLTERMAIKWVLDHQFMFLRALIFVMMDLTDEVSNGAIDMAKTSLDKMIRICVDPSIQESNAELLDARNKGLHDVTRELVRQVTSPHTIVREQAMTALRQLAEIQNKTVTEVMEPHKEVLADMIPPRKHLLRHQPANAQIGLMDGTTFCTALNPRLFTIDLNVAEHKVFFQELLGLCEAEEANLAKLSCYKSVTNLMPLRKSALRALAASHYIVSCRERIFTVLYKALEKSNGELQEAAFECMRTFISGFQIDMESVHTTMRPMLLTLGDHRNLSLNCVKRLSYLTQLFPSTFSITLCEQLLQHLKKLLENLIQTQKGILKTGENEQKITTIIGIFHEIPAATPKFIDLLCRLVLHTEKTLLVEVSSPFRVPLMKFLLRYPADTLSLFLHDNNIKDQQWSRYLEYLIKHKDGKPIRDILHNSSTRLVAMLLTHSNTQTNSNLSHMEKSELQYRAIKIIALLIRFDEQWLSTQTQLVSALKQIWCANDYQALHKKVENVEYYHWKEPKLIVKILLHYFRQQPNDIDLLFYLLRATCDRFIPDFQFLRDFLENTVAQEYTVEWKRSAFFRFVEHFPTNNLSQELKANVLQLIIIPCFAVSFERGEGTKLVGGAPMPYQDNPENVVSVFISKIIDPDNPFGSADCVRISLLQFSCLLVEQASQHIHDVTNKRQGNKLRRLMTFAWPCLLGKNCVDPTTRYHGHLLLSHIIAKFAIHKRIVLQVFHSLLKAHAVDARNVVRQALEILTPAMPVRMEDGNTMLTHWTKKIIVEEGHSMQQLFHILQLVVRHFKVYYPVRHHLVQHIVNSIQRLGFSPTATIEHRKLAVELAEVIIKWELYRIKDESEAADSNSSNRSVTSGIKRQSTDESPNTKRLTSQTTSSNICMPLVSSKTESMKAIDRIHSDAILNFLLRLACQVNDVSSMHGNPGELLSKRCVNLLKMGLKPDIWTESCDLKLAWLDKVLASVDNSQPNYGNISTALDVLTFLLGVMKREQILASFKPLQRGIGACIASNNTKIIRLVHGLLSRLMTIFPAELTSSNVNVSSKNEELDTLYATVGRFIADGLATYEKSASATPSSLFGTLMMLKAACTNNPSYIDRMITPFMRVLHRMAKEHLHSSSQTETNAVGSELLILSMDLVKNRVVVMGAEMRKSFIGTILTGLIEKTQDIKVMKAITKMLEEWMKNKNTIAMNQTPTMREKTVLLCKMMQYVEKRFPDDLELNRQFLELINYIYRDESLKSTDLNTKLEQAFLSGLRCVQPQVRAKFFEVLDASMSKQLQERLLYIISTQNWENIGPHYWIKQCIELILSSANPNTQIQMTNQDLLLPSVKSIIHMGMDKDNKDHKDFMAYCSIKEEPKEISETNDAPETDFFEMELSNMSISEFTSTLDDIMAQSNLTDMINKQSAFIERAKKIKTEQLLLAVVQLCHMDTNLAERVWLDMFPRLWTILEEHHQTVLIGEVVPFVASGSHVNQKDCHPSALGTFLEALSHCNPPVVIKPYVMKYLGKSHNVWHRMTLTLEQMASESDNSVYARTKRELDFYDFEQSPEDIPNDIMDALADMYSLLLEEDMWSGIWQKHAYYKETLHAIALQQQGFFEQAQGAYDVVMTKFQQDWVSTPSPYKIQKEVIMIGNQWVRCAKELNQWDMLLEYSTTKDFRDPFVALESSWRISNWPVMKEALALVEHNCPKEMAWKVNMYRGFIAICHEEQHMTAVERYVEIASTLCMREWRKLPQIVSHIHLPLLQAAQQIMELQEAAQIHQGLMLTRSSSLHDMKAIVKTWRNRLPVIADDLSHWSDIFAWRQQHYNRIANHYESQPDSHSAPSHSVLGVHASMQSIIHYGKIARKQNLYGVCLDSLSKIYTIPSVPMIDCFQKVRQRVKCYMQMATMSGQNELQEGLDVIECTDMRYFSKEMTAEFYALKGLLLSQLGRSDDANKAFSAAVQLHDTLVKAWALWGDYLEQIFARDARQISIGIAAITCFLHAARHQNETKSRKYIAKVIWLLTYDDDKSSLMETLDKYSIGVPAIQWLPWVPQLLMYLVRYEGNSILTLLSQVGRMFPQAVYFSIRTLYLTLKIEQRERYNSELTAGKIQESSQEDRATGNVSQQGVSETSGHTVRATAPMWRCSKIMHMQRDIHPTVLSSLEGIVDQMVWFRETWYEEVLRQLTQGLAKCYALAFENRGAVSEATITPHTLNFVKKLVSTFGIGIENISSSQNTSFYSAASESLARRAQDTVQDPVFHRMKGQFTSDFDFTVPGARLLHNLINKLKKWIKILEEKTKQLPRSFLIEEKCRFLSNFSLKTAEVELPGEFLIPRHSHYSVKIARFMPRVEVVQRHNTAARRLRIRGHNGRLYPYLVVNDASVGDARREERVLQLLRMLNHYLAKQKETSRRFLHFTVPRLVAVSPQMRLVEDNPAAVSLLDVFKQGCAKLGMEHDAPIARYYEKLAAVQARGIQASHQVLRDILKEVQTTMVSKTMLKDWAIKTFPGATDYWTFRKMFTLQLSLTCFAEYVLHLTRLNPDMMYMHQDSGLINIAYFKFDIDDISGELDANRPVPFRLTPNIYEFITTTGVAGPLTASAIATARCLVQPSYQLHAILRAILRDEVIAEHKRQEDTESMSQTPTDLKGELLIKMVTHAVTAIISRLNSLAHFDGIDSKVSTLVTAANSHDNLCRMDPSWHPWL